MAQFPVGGPREPVYEALRNLGFQMSTWSDKQWTARDGLTAHVYGTGSMLAVHRDKELLIDAPMAEALEFIRNLTKRD